MMELCYPSSHMTNFEWAKPIATEQLFIRMSRPFEPIYFCYSVSSRFATTAVLQSPSLEIS